MLKNMDSSRRFVPVKPGSCNHCPAGHVLILSWMGCLAHSRLSLLILRPCGGQSWSVFLRVLSKLPVCMQILLRPFSAALKAVQKSWTAHAYCWSTVPRKAFSLELGTEQTGLGGSLAWAWELERGKPPSLNVNFLNDSSSVINRYLLIRPGFMKVYSNLQVSPSVYT